MAHTLDTDAAVDAVYRADWGRIVATRHKAIDRLRRRTWFEEKIEEYTASGLSPSAGCAK